MMLRSVVVVLVLANLVFWAWTAGALDAIGLGPARERDPSRWALQVQPDSVRVLPASAPAAAAAGPAGASAMAGPSPTGADGAGLLCLESGPIAPTAIAAAERALAGAALPEGSWQRSAQTLAAVYAVVLGPFASRESQQKKVEEIGRLRLPTEAVELPAEAGVVPAVLALGRYDNRAAADAALASFVQRGVRTARVAVLRAAASETRLRVDKATPAQAERLRALSDPALGAAFAPCTAAPAEAGR